MTADDPVEWIGLLIEEGQHLYVDGEEMRAHEEVVTWEARAERWTEKAISGVQARSRDVATVRTLGRRPLVRMPVGHPYWTRPQVFIEYNTSSAVCAENNPLSRLHNRIESLKVIADRWRANPPAPTKPAKVAEPAPSAVRPNRRGRKKGSGGYDTKDLPLIEEMHRLITSEEPMGRYHAMLKVVDRAEGETSAINRGKRLLKGYNKKYGLQ